MNRIRLLLFITISWLLFVINIEKLLEPASLSFLNIHPIAYVLLIGIFLTALALPESTKLTYKICTSVGIIIYAAISVVLAQGDAVLEVVILNFLFEVVILVISATIAYELRAWFINYDASLKESIFRPAKPVIDTIFSDIEKIEKKISRARRFENELSIIHLDLTDTLNEGVDKNQLSACLAETLQIIESKSVSNAWYEDHLMICVPAGTDSIQVNDLTKNLKRVVTDVLNVGSELAVASFPRDGLVLSDLLTNVSPVHKMKQHTSRSKPSIFYNLKPKFQVQTSKLLG